MEINKLKDLRNVFENTCPLYVTYGNVCVNDHMDDYNDYDVKRAIIRKHHMWVELEQARIGG